MGKKTYFDEPEEVKRYKCTTCNGKGKVWVEKVPIWRGMKENEAIVGYEEVKENRDCFFCNGSGHVSAMGRYFQACNEEAERRHKK